MTFNHPVIFVAGPTCSGKTQHSIAIADALKGVIINADSLQMYQGMKIGAAQPNWSQYPDISHYLFNWIQPPHLCTAGVYEREAKKILQQCISKGPCLVVGGSGFYLQALEKGCYSVSAQQISLREQLKREIQENGISTLYKELQQKDLKYSQQIHSHDTYRLIRALSVIRSENKKMSEIKSNFKEKVLPYPIVKIGITGSLDVLKKRVNIRAKQMIQNGLIEEVQRLLDRGLRDFFPMKGVGYKEVLLYLDGKIHQKDLQEAIVQRTMQLIKKQKKWFKRDQSIRWYDCETDSIEIVDDLLDRIQKNKR